MAVPVAIQHLDPIVSGRVEDAQVKSRTQRLRDHRPRTIREDQSMNTANRHAQSFRQFPRKPDPGDLRSWVQHSRPDPSWQFATAGSTFLLRIPTTTPMSIQGDQIESTPFFPMARWVHDMNRKNKLSCLAHGHSTDRSSRRRLHLINHECLTGFESRWWTAKNIDSVSTSVSHYSKCIDAATEGGWIPKNVTYSLRRQRSLMPDADMGERTATCTKTVSVYWGDVRAASYRIRVTKINGQISGAPMLTVKDWRVKY